METEVSTEGGLRHGRMTLTNNGTKKELLFPGCILSTNAGTVPHLTRETYSYIPKDLHPSTIQIPMPTVIDHESIFSSYPGWSGELMSLPPSTLMFVSTKESLLKTRNTPTPSLNTTKAVSVWGNQGRIMMTVEKHMHLVSTLKPDMFEVLADGDTMSEDVSKKRVSKSYSSSLKFLEESLDVLKENERLGNSYIIPALEGGNSAELRTKFASETLRCLEAKNTMLRCAGFLVDGICFEKPSTKASNALVKASLEPLPQEKLRFVHGQKSPRHVFDLLECGIDIFDTSYPINLAQKNMASNVCLHKGTNSEKAPQNSDTVLNGMDSWHGAEILDLSDVIHKESFEPLLQGCSCYTCQNHTRAYIHHLVSVKELLAPLLLTLHNLQDYLVFFERLRRSLNEGSYAEFKSSIVGSVKLA